VANNDSFLSKLGDISDFTSKYEGFPSAPWAKKITGLRWGKEYESFPY
jgi:hypothetical protein